MDRNPIWVKVAMMTLVHMFYLLGLYINLGKNKFMTCTPGFVWGDMFKVTYKHQEVGGATTLR